MYLITLRVSVTTIRQIGPIPRLLLHAKRLHCVLLTRVAEGTGCQPVYRHPRRHRRFAQCMFVLDMLPSSLCHAYRALDSEVVGW